jgi:prepilin-type N-terminal cleavage/methylation domain-containing protein
MPYRMVSISFHRCSRGFTLVELMASIALVLLLILGVNQVFRIATKGVGAGQDLSTIQRDNLTAHSVIYSDFKNLAFPDSAGSPGTGPAFIIRSERQYAYRNRPEHLSDPDGAPKENPGVDDIKDRDLNADNDEADTNEISFPARVDDRSHRVDQLVFFTQGLFRRQTGNDGTYVAPMSSTEAYLWYGHLKLPDFTTPMATQQFAHRSPAETPYNTNRENAYTTQWSFGRIVVLLRAKEPSTVGGEPNRIRDTSNTDQTFIDRPNPPPYSTPAVYYNTLAPLWPEAEDNAPGGVFRFTWGRYDLAATTIAEFRDILSGYHALWLPSSNALQRWDYRMTSERHQANPFPTKPMSSFGVARTAPILLRGCTQFIVEFAGDFVTQDNNVASATYGLVANQDPPVPDGVTDYVVLFNDANNNGQIDSDPERVGMRAATRWYGMPRDTNGDGVIAGFLPGRPNNHMIDVVPLRDVVSSGIGALYAPLNGSGYQVEKFDNLTTPTNAQGNYMAGTGAGFLTDSRYFASWGPDTQNVPKPRMIRIVLALDTPTASIAEAQLFEYVIEVP